MGVIIALVILILVALAIAVSCIKIVPQAHAVVVERLGGYLTTWSVGLHFKAPFIDRVAKRVLLKEQVVDFPPQPVITKDNVTMQIDTVVYFQITDPKLYAYGVENPIMAIENLTATTLRNIIGDLELDETLTSRETINTKMRASLDVATDPWGIKVNRVELKNIIPPAAIQDAMEKQMKAERERREAILRAEGEKKSTVLVAEGKKESAILDAEAEKQAAILRAEAQKEKMVMCAIAKKENITITDEETDAYLNDYAAKNSIDVDSLKSTLTDVECKYNALAKKVMDFLVENAKATEATTAAATESATEADSESADDQEETTAEETEADTEADTTAE